MVKPGIFRIAQSTLLLLSALLCLSLSLCYGIRPDSCAAVTIWPVWIWLLPGLLLNALGWSRAGKRFAFAVLFLWAAYLLVLAEEPASLLRLREWPSREWQDARNQGRAIRVVSLNCAGGSREAAEEVIPYHPDIVLLQESPVRKEGEALARRLFGKGAGVAWGLDASIIARGDVAPVDLPSSLRIFMTRARLRLATGIEVEVISIRLIPPVYRDDLLSPECWREQARNRRARREQLRSAVRQIESLPSHLPLIVGGDFNAPAGDAIYRLLRPRLRDTFQESGTGWGNTIMNDLPVLRIDQIWVNHYFHTSSVLARKTLYSDHRMVICDLLLDRD